VQRGVDTASGVADVLAAKLSVLADPRARALRKQKWALRLALFFGFTCLFWAVVTVLLAAWGWFQLLLIITGSIAVGAAVPATLLLLRYRWLRSRCWASSSGGGCCPPPRSAISPPRPTGPPRQ
jgi:hypothetical protein